MSEEEKEGIHDNADLSNSEEEEALPVTEDVPKNAVKYERRILLLGYR